MQLEHKSKKDFDVDEKVNVNLQTCQNWFEKML